MARYIDEIIMLLGGIWATGVAFGYIAPPGKDPAKREEWLRRFRPLFKVLGPILIVISLILAFGEAARHAGN